MEILITEEQLRTILAESYNEKDSFETETCKSFTDNSANEFCRGIYKILSTVTPYQKNRIQSKFKDVETLIQKEKQGEYKVIYDDIRNITAMYIAKIQDLQTLINKVSPNCSRLKDKAKEKMVELKENGEKLLLYQKNNEDGVSYEYSLLNKLNTNYSGLSILMTEYAIHNEPNKSPEEIVKLFVGGGIDTPKILNYLRDILIKPNHVRRRILSSIERTTEKGMKSEEEYFKYLDKIRKKYISFSDNFGVVDRMGIDTLVEKNGQFYPVQIKSSKNQAERKLAIWAYNVGKCQCSVVYPLDKNYNEWGTITKKTSTEVEDNLITSELKPAYRVDCKTVNTWKNPRTGSLRQYCNGASIKGEDIPKKYRFVDFYYNDAKYIQVDRSKTILQTKLERAKIPGKLITVIHFDL